MEIDASRSVTDTQYEDPLRSEIALLKNSISGRRLIVSDVDSTFIKQEVIDLLAQFAGVGPQVAEITDLAMRGDIDFTESLQLRVKTLNNQPVEILDHALNIIQLSDGAAHLVDELHKAEHVFALISGGFIQVLEPIANSVGVIHFAANELEILDGFLTGRVIGPIIDAAAKGEYLEQLAANLNIPMINTIAIGDGANDLVMMQKAGISVSFNGKPKVKNYADVHLAGTFIDHVLALI
jgi:phosphoserine phosphatase